MEFFADTAITLLFFWSLLGVKAFILFVLQFFIILNADSEVTLLFFWNWTYWLYYKLELSQILGWNEYPVQIKHFCRVRVLYEYYKSISVLGLNENPHWVADCVSDRLVVTAPLPYTHTSRVSIRGLNTSRTRPLRSHQVSVLRCALQAASACC